MSDIDPVLARLAKLPPSEPNPPAMTLTKERFIALHMM